MKLTNEQEEFVREYVEDQGLEMQALNDVIINHLCFVIQSELGKEKSFESLLKEAVKNLALEGLIEIAYKKLFFSKF